MNTQSSLSSNQFATGQPTIKGWLNKLKVGEKIALGHIVSLGMAIAGTTTGIVVGNQHQQKALQQQVHTQEEVELLSALQTGVLQARTHQQQLIPRSESPEDFKDEYNHVLIHAASISEEWANIETHLKEKPEDADLNSQDQTISDFMQTHNGVASNYLKELENLVKAIDPDSLNTPAEAKQAQKQLLTFTNSDLAISFDAISDELLDLIANSREHNHTAAERAEIAKSLRNRIIFLSMLSSSALALISASIISRAISAPLKAAEETAIKVIRTEDFNLRATVSTEDEVGTLATALNQLIEWVGYRTKSLENSRDTLEKRVKERTQQLNAILDSLGSGLLVSDLDGRIIRANPIVSEMFQLKETVIDGQLIEDLFENMITQLIKQNQACPEKSLSANVALPNNCIGQATVTAIMMEESSTDENNKVVGTVLLIRDITTEKAVDQMKTDFISTVSHELRTPLTSVLGFAKIIQKKLETVLIPAVDSEQPKIQRASRQVKENLNIIISEGERLTSLINDVLDIAKIESGKVEWNMQPLNPKDVVEQAIAATSVLAQNSKIILKADIAPDLPTIVADQGRLIQVVINLISNAIKFTRKGSVTCEVKCTEDELRISVIDTGMGIKAEDQPKVFEKFKQVGEIMTDKPKGTGLGLPICKQIVEYHGGRIWVESQLDVGSTFSVALPLSGVPLGDSALMETSSEIASNSSHAGVEALVRRLKADVRQTAPASDGEPKTILVVDDEPNIRRLLRQELETEGYLVKEAKDGVAALETIKQAPPDLIITDVMMPRLDGFDLTAVLKTNPETANIPTIILSIVEDQIRGFRLGVDRYLTKPIDIGSLLSNVENLLTHKTSRSKVLVVNRDASTSKTLTEVLLSKGYVVAEASTGQEGLDKARSLKPDMMIVDAALSEEYNIVSTLRFEKGLENISVILMEENSKS
jgi:signal transduction histidine kinase/DNA-binding response OmpR family regulator